MSRFYGSNAGWIWYEILNFLFTAPSFEDVQRLTKLHAFMHESLRWRPVVLLGRLSSFRCQRHLTVSTGFPRRATRDIIWVCEMGVLETRTGYQIVD